MTKTCSGDTGAYPGGCYVTTTWIVQNEVTGVELGACDSRVGQVVDALRRDDECTRLSVYLKAGA